MKILNVLHQEAIIPKLSAQDKKGILDELAAPISALTGVGHKELVRVLLEREQLGSTGIGEGIGIPHGKLKELQEMVIGFGISKRGVDFDSIDGRPVHIFFVLLTPEQSTGLHLRLLARISRILKNESFRERLLRAADGKEIFNIIKSEDEEF